MFSVFKIGISTLCVVGLGLGVIHSHNQKRVRQLQDTYQDLEQVLASRQYAVKASADSAKPTFGKVSSGNDVEQIGSRFPDLQVRGTVISNRYVPSVVVEFPSGKQRMVKLGDEIEGAWVKRISSDNVVLDLQGKKITLPMHSPERACPFPTDFNARERRTVFNEPSGPLSKGESIRQVAASEWLVSKSIVKTSLAQASKIMTQVRIVPYFHEQQAAGFQILYMDEECILTQLGIEEGDVVQKLNGKILDNPFAALEMFSSLQLSNSLCIEIQRQEKIQRLTYRVG